MKKEHINIDDLFNQARNQSPVFTKEDARSLVETRADKGFANNYTRLRFLKGVKPMNILIASLATAGAVSFFALNPFGTMNNKDTGSGNAVQQKVYASALNDTKQEETPAPKPDDKAKAKNIIITKVGINHDAQAQNMAATTELRNDACIDIKGIKPIILDDKQLSQLGIIKAPEGIKLWLTGGTQPPMLCTLLVKGGLIMGENDNDNNKTIAVTKLLPRIITDNAGNKRLTAFEDESYLGQYSQRTETDVNSVGGSKIVSDVRSVVLINDKNADSTRQSPGNMPLTPGSSLDGRMPKHPGSTRDNMPNSPGMVPPPHIEIQINGADTNWTKQFKELNIQLDTLLQGRLKDVEKMLEKLNIDKGNIRQFIVPPLPPPMGRPNRQMMDLEKQARDLDKQALDIDKQALDLEKQALKIEKDARKQKDKQVTTDQANKLRDKALDLHDKASELRDKALELRDKALEMKEKMFDMPDSADYNFDMNFDFDFPDSDSEKDLNLNDIINDVKIRVSNNLTPVMTRINALEDNMNNLVRINKLVPVEVQMGRNPDRNFYNDNEEFSFILWYEPTEEFLKVLPADLRQKIEPEVRALQGTTNICQAAPVAADEAYFDIWRSCSGAVENLAVFPNPASDYINVKYNLSQARNIEISLHDLSGRKIRSLATFDTCPVGAIDRKFEITDLQPGMYLVSVQTDKNEQAVQRVIVER